MKNNENTEREVNFTFLLIVLILGLVLSTLSLGRPIHSIANCRIQIRNELRNGEVQTITFRLTLTSRLQCAELAKIHQLVKRDDVKSLWVSYSWATGRKKKS